MGSCRPVRGSFVFPLVDPALARWATTCRPLRGLAKFAASTLLGYEPNETGWRLEAAGFQAPAYDLRPATSKGEK